MSVALCVGVNGGGHRWKVRGHSHRHRDLSGGGWVTLKAVLPRVTGVGGWARPAGLQTWKPLARLGVPRAPSHRECLVPSDPGPLLSLH